MFRVVIIDDEALVRVGLKSLINWEAAGFEIVGEAANGQQGLELVLKERPDIVITDIKMPILSGIEMIEQIQAVNNGIKYIVLSGYDEFHLVKQAMKLGIEEYMVKLELEPEVLKGLLESIADKIKLERVENDKKNRYEMHLRVNKPVMREEFFKKLISRLITKPEEISESAAYLDINLNENRLVCASIKINNRNMFESMQKEDLQLLDFSVINVVEEIVNDVFTGYAFKWDAGEYTVIFSYEEDAGSKNLAVETDKMADRLIRMLKKYFNLSVSIGLSQVYKGLTQMDKAYRESYQAVSRSFFSGNEKVLYFSTQKDSKPEMSKIEIFSQREELVKALELNDVEAIQDIFGNIAAALDSPQITEKAVYDACFQLAYLISGSISDGEELLKQVMEDDSVYESIFKLNSLEKIKSWVEGLGRNLCQGMLKNNDQQTRRLVTKAKKYINEHYTQDIKMTYLADRLNISASYFSTIFRKETGLCFTDYVTEVKISHAKKLMVQSDLKIYQISDMLGYENSNYFSRVFKKVTGLTPTEFLSKANV